MRIQGVQAVTVKKPSLPREPWTYGIDSKGTPIGWSVDADGEVVIFTREVLERVNACVNAMAGIEDPAAFVRTALEQNQFVKDVLNAESDENEAERKRRGLRYDENIIGGRWAVNAAMYRLSYTAQELDKMTVTRPTSEGES
jgi:hypothetical protein